jgi:cytidine deaminase
MPTWPLDAEDEELIAAAQHVLERCYQAGKHEVGAAVRCASGRVTTGVNIEACAYGPCAEPIAIGAAIASGETDFLSVVAVTRPDRDAPFRVLSPCGNCRQLMVDYAPRAMIIFDNNGQVVKTEARNLLPGAYLSHFGED